MTPYIDLPGPQRPDRPCATTVGRDDPRYFDLKFFATPDPGQTEIQARIEQVKAIKARGKLHYSLIKIKAPARGEPARPGTTSEMVCNIQSFGGLVPDRPYCVDFVGDDLKIRVRAHALRKRHLQLNGPTSFAWLVHDIDRPDAALAHREANLPPPSFIAINPENGHAHSAMLLAVPVARHSASRVGPLQFYAGVERGIARRLGADRCYRGVIAKNPVHRDWRVEWRREQPYTLPELRDWLFDRDMVPDASPSEAFGAGRNCTVFEELRKIAYREVREFKAAGQTIEAFQERLVRVALGINMQFPQALGLGEVRAISKSVAKWTWKRFSIEKFAARQSFLGKRGMAKRWAGHVAESATKPWEAMGISRRTYYTRKKLGQL